VHWTGHDATGSGDSFRAELGDQGPAIEHLQHELNVNFPAYSHLEEDGEYGHATEAVIEEFDHRAAAEAGVSAADRHALAEADGENIGPAGARSLHRHHLI
jgi:peptidoglycan hydrolase-like protein with peptidoglycan-binding domain